MIAPNETEKATRTTPRPRPIRSSAMVMAKSRIKKRTKLLKSRGEREFALTAARRAAREKKLAARTPKRRISRATTNWGNKETKLEISCWRATIPSAFTPTSIKHTHTAQKTIRLIISAGEGRAASVSHLGTTLLSQNPLSRHTTRE